MKVSFLQCSSTGAAQSLLLLHTPTTFTFSCSLKPKIPTHVIKTTRISATRDVPARDRVIEFGRHKGRMLGTLPSRYLKWVSNNLRARDLQEWAVLADQVLDDPVYRDRIEWELAEKVLTGDGGGGGVSSSSRSDGAVSELLEISERFGWDNDDKVGWSRIDFGLLGTSKGGRIPRVSEENYGVVGREFKFKRERVNRGAEEERSGEKRRERRERMRMKNRDGLRLGPSERTMRLGFGGGMFVEKKGNGKVEDDDGGGRDDYDQGRLVRKEDRTVEFTQKKDRTVESGSPFPGRQSLLKKVLNSRKKIS